MKLTIAAAIVLGSVTVAYASDARVIGGRPKGCPHAFCGCAASLEVFGKIIPALNLAWNWVVYFNRAAPAPGMAAARRGHVFILKEDRGNGRWLVIDGNTGNRKTGRHKIIEHVRSLRGYIIVNPHSPRQRLAGTARSSVQ